MEITGFADSMRHLGLNFFYAITSLVVAVVSLILGQALFFGDWVVLGYGAVVWLAVHTFVLAYEEPTLQRDYGEQYDRYRANVRRWIPRLTPYRA